MGKIVYFLPAIIFTAFYGLIIIGTGMPVHAMVYIWIALFVISGILMFQNKFWGGFLGVLPGGYLMYMSTIDTGQVMNIELPLGIIVVVFYLLCSGYIFIQNRKKV